MYKKDMFFFLWLGLILATWASQQVGLARIGGPQEGYPAWAGQEQLIGGVVVAAGERASRELWVPQMHAGAAWTGSKRPRPSSLGSSSYW